MRVFVTGASGFVGSAVVAELIAAGRQVLGLARSEASALSVAAAGAQVHRGDLTDLESLRSGAAATDAVIHTAFIHDFSKFAENCEIDRRAIEALGAVLAGSDRPLIVTSGTGLLTPGHLATEDTVRPTGSAIPRVSEQAGLSLVSQGVRVSAMRLPPTVHGDGDHGFVPILIGLARDKGASAYIGDGNNRWPAVHRLDAAQLYRLVLEKGTAGAVYHAVAEQGVPFREIAEAIGRGLNLPVKSVTGDEVEAYFGGFAMFAGVDNPASSALTRQWLNWRPEHVGLIEDIEAGHYFEQK